MLSPQIRCVVGIDVAKQAHVVCALEAPSGVLRHRASRIEASAEGYALVQSWLASWGEPESILVGMEATGPLWEPLYDTRAQAGYTVLLRESAANRGLGGQFGIAGQNRRDRRPHARPWVVGRARAGQHPADRDGASHACPHTGTARLD